MTVLSDYTSGTISLAQGSVTVTGTGTLFEVTNFREGDTLQIQNLTAVIASVNSDTSLTLAEPWTGTSIVNGAYRARQLGDVSRYPTQAATIIELLGNGVLSSLAELGAQAGKLPIGNSSGGYDLIDQTEIGGTPDPNGSVKKLADIELGNRQILQTDEAGALKAVELAENKALVTDANKDVQQIDLGTLGRALLALTTGTTAHYVQGDGTLQAKASLPVSAAAQTALDGKANLSGAAFTGAVSTTGALSTNGMFSMRAENQTANASLIRWHNYSNGLAWALTLQRQDFEGLTYSAFNNGTWLRDVLTISKSGNVAVTGAISKGSGTFLIDHPTDPFNKNLRHGFVESTEYVNIYRGIVDLIDGRMTVDIDAAFGMTDGTFEALNADVMVSSLQNQYGPDRVWVEAAPDSGKFTIVCENTQSIATIAWMVTGRRNDAFVRSALDPNTDSEGRFIPEFDKEDA